MDLKTPRFSGQGLRSRRGVLRDTGAADCGAWDYHPDEPEDEGEAVSSP
jgi:hypothetical protein